MPAHDAVQSIRTKFAALRPQMTERLRRHWAAAEAMALGRGGITAGSGATGMSRTTITQGIRELRRPGPAGGEEALPPGRSRRPGGGGKPLTRTDPTRLADLDALVEPSTRGDPQSPLRWTCTSTRKLAERLQAQGHRVGAGTVAALLKRRGYSLQGNRKTKEGGSHPDRDAQFQYIARRARSFQHRRQPVVSGDAKTKELVGEYKNGGREGRPKGTPEEVKVSDFQDKQLGKAIPYGVYDVAADQGWISVGVDHDTARFAAEALRRWWEEMGSKRYPEARELLVTADGGGSNGSRNRLWKVALQELADATGLEVAVSHFPPGTSKWNKIEHRLFCHDTQNWRGRPLRSLEIIVRLIGSTTTSTGLVVRAELDPKPDATGLKVSDEELAAVRIKTAKFHSEWNYTISPRDRR
jgi:Rhodopirellula transposase DDE domain